MRNKKLRFWKISNNVHHTFHGINLRPLTSDRSLSIFFGNTFFKICKKLKRRENEKGKPYPYPNKLRHPILLKKRLYVLVMPRTRFRVNNCLNIKSSLLEAGTKFCVCLERGVPWHSLWIHFETCTWHDKNIQSNAT